MANDKWLNNIARVIKKKDGGFFLKFERRKDKNKQYIGDNPFPLVINEGDILQMRAKKDELAKLVADGKMSQETADKICETVRFEISKAPDSTAKATAPASSAPPKKDNNGVNF